MTTIELVTAPTVRPITLAQAKEHLRVEITDEDDLIELYIKAATDYYQETSFLQLITATYKLYLDEFPIGVIEIPNAPLQSIVEILYSDTDGTEQTWSDTLYEFDAISTPGRLRPVDGESYPGTNNQLNAVSIEFTAGYGLAADVPDEITQTIKLLVAWFYEHRDLINVNATNVQQIPMPDGIKDMIAKKSLREFI